MTEICEGAFGLNQNLTNLQLGNSLTTIGKYAFYECLGLTTITVPENVNVINDRAFQNCYTLSEIINLSSLSIVKGSTDNGQIAEHAVIVKKTGQSSMESIGDYLFLKSNLGANYLIKYTGKDSEIILPESTNEQLYIIHQYAFYNNQNITKVTFSDSVASIDKNAFEECKLLSNVIIGSNVTEIGEYAFYNCTNLISATLGESVVTIDSDAFYKTNLLEVINLSPLTITQGSTSNGYVGYYAVSIRTSGTSEATNINEFIFLKIEDKNYLVGYTTTDTQIVLPESVNGETYQIYENLL